MELRFSFREIASFLKEELTGAFQQSKWLPFFTALAVLSSNIGPIPRIPYIHVPLIGLCLLQNLGRHWTVEKACVVLLFYLPLNIIITDPDPVFKSWSRLGFFILVFTIASPFFIGEYISKVRKGILTGVLIIAFVLALGSFFCYFIGINYMRSQYDGSELSAELYTGSAGAFGGLTTQSIVLGLFSGISTLYMFYRVNENPQDKLKYFVCIGILMISLFFAASRSALLSTLAGFSVMLYQTYENKATFFKILIAIVICAILSFPLWEGATEGMMKKQKSNEKIEGKYGSRSEKWEARMLEFANSPVFGVGFSAQDPEGKDTYDKVNGTIEPGSSWLCILSMTGIIGFVLILFIFLRPFLFLSENPSPYNNLLLGLLVFFFVAFIAEGYIFAGGSALCFTAWLVFGCANDVREGYIKDKSQEDDD